MRRDSRAGTVSHRAQRARRGPIRECKNFSLLQIMAEGSRLLALSVGFVDGSEDQQFQDDRQPYRHRAGSVKISKELASRGFKFVADHRLAFIAGNRMVNDHLSPLLPRDLRGQPAPAPGSHMTAGNSRIQPRLASGVVGRRLRSLALAARYRSCRHRQGLARVGAGTARPAARIFFSVARTRCGGGRDARAMPGSMGIPLAHCCTIARICHRDMISTSRRCSAGGLQGGGKAPVVGDPYARGCRRCSRMRV